MTNEELKGITHIVCLSTPNEPPKKYADQKEGGGYKANYCLEISHLNGEEDGQTPIFFKNWKADGVWSSSIRIAKDYEIEYYKKVGKPYDVTEVFKNQVSLIEIW